MSNETQKVDVLAVIAEARSVMERTNRPEHAADLDRTFAAVAELVKEANIALGWMQGTDHASKRARDRFRAALARVGGAA